MSGDLLKALKSGPFFIWGPLIQLGVLVVEVAAPPQSLQVGGASRPGHPERHLPR